MTLTIGILIIAGYLLGSIPSAVWIGKWFYHTDVREHGSHNAGATNTLRVLGRRAALPVFVIDAAKGYAAVMLSHFAELEGDALFFLKIGLTAAAILGHIFPLFAGFKGGKGVATMAGCMLAIAPVPMLLGLATFIVVLAATHYVSLGSMTGGVLFPVYIILIDGFHSPYKIGFGVFVAVVLLITHRKNIQRLRAGTENKTYLFLKRPKL
ncbi:glycerol-3-phosphate 1-O-acyltransferase PlsY [Rikenella microfusus]|uniref:glycerol-3-phosphate 1-O-acyltransferase PlsY n=1 Tax=Rikenella microfusus TaxID=28139 RepID=UPI001D27807A|nr:glycerol-3-phosphate 1-O-acyltransferase PlsY [Rikenella microfusus]HJE88522.1 glycerol-3-phosphate 1-O-acyltransferase PlsY [Rikenella microfusus]